MPLLNDEVQPEADLVDEVVHVALEAAVVVAEEETRRLAVEKHPAGKMDGADPRQPARACRRAGRRSRSPRARASSSTSRTRPGFRLPIALNWLVTSWSSTRPAPRRAPGAAVATQLRGRSSPARRRRTTSAARPWQAAATSARETAQTSSSSGRRRARWSRLRICPAERRRRLGDSVSRPACDVPSTSARRRWCMHRGAPAVRAGGQCGSGAAPARREAPPPRAPARTVRPASSRSWPPPAPGARLHPLRPGRSSALKPSQHEKSARSPSRRARRTLAQERVGIAVDLAEKRQAARIGRRREPP